MRRITGHLHDKNGKWYAIVNHYDTEGKRKVRWHNLELPVTKGNKKEAQHRLQRLLDQINTGDLYLMENMSPAERERHRLAESLVEDYLLEWIESHSKKVATTTAEQYRRYLELRVIPFFKELHVKMKEVTGDEINAFYETLVAEGLKGTSQQRYHGVLHKAFKDAMKRRIIPSNPVEQADRPRSVPYIGEY
ncbi:MAG: phage integrase SAM-like domain-containing protein, partial [Clostridia bacterium]|nr:phage integrase SAM-like domain-containing protein [Clostridia bacterium]